MAERRLREGDGVQTILHDEVVVLDYTCRDCGRLYEVAISCGSQLAQIDCNEARLCEPCEKRRLVVGLLERGTTVPEERLLQMTVDELLSVERSV